MLFARLMVIVALVFPGSAFAAEPVGVQRSLTLDGALRVIAAIEAESASRQTTGAVAVVDAGGNLIAVHRTDGTFAAGGNVSIGKARTAALFQRPTRIFEDIITKGRTPMIALEDFTPLQGGVPIVMDGQIVGAVGVSGASSAQEDDELAQVGADALGPASVSTPTGAPTTLVERARVEQAFGSSALGGTLFEAPAGVFAVHASRRTEPGQAEVHREQTDIFYIVSGRAEFVTGGRLASISTTTADEPRAERIEGGTAQAIQRGDLVIVPAGTPHWFRSIDEPVHYLVVKITASDALAAAD